MSNALGFMLALPINAAMIYCVYKDYREYKDRQEHVRRKLDNLKREVIQVDLSEVELEMLEQLQELKKEGTASSYLRSSIMAAIKKNA